MPYVDYTYYIETYKGTLVSDTDFPLLELRASEMIDDLTMYRVAQTSLSNYSTFIQEQLKKAVCAQIDYIESNGGVDSLNEQSSQSMALGKFNYSGTMEQSNIQISPLVTQYLFITGLLYRGIG